MPLAFQSLNQGTVPFGFFHLETDLLLCGDRFFWCREFCLAIDGLATGGRSATVELPGWVIGSAAGIGDLHGAIAGRSDTGLIGQLYARWPFPATREGFRQKVNGVAPVATVETLLDRYGRRCRFALQASESRADTIELDTVRFAEAEFAQLIDYIWRGGMPGWDGVNRSGYLAAAAALWRSSAVAWLAAVDFDDPSVGMVR